MKVLVNGGLNLSELDGWWAEAYSPEVGWALGDKKEHDADPAWTPLRRKGFTPSLSRRSYPIFITGTRKGYRGHGWPA